jgi:hypothetical protein
MKKPCQLLLSILLLAACQPATYKGYSHLNEHTQHRLIELGDGEGGAAQRGDYVSALITFCSLQGDTLYHQPAPVTFQLHSVNALDTAFTLFNVGDSVSLIWEKQHPLKSVLNVVYPVDTLNEIMINFRITALRTARQFYEDSLYYVKDARLLEQVYLADYLRAYGLQPENSTNGIYFMPLHQDSTRRALQVGNTIEVGYTARFLDGRIFDATSNWSEPFIFEYGLPLQIIDGLQSALSLMNEGDEAKIIIPSHLAFGNTGSSTGTVPPFTSVVYHLRLKKIY